MAPIDTAVPKLSATLQASGEARYTDDEPLPVGALHGAMVFSTEALATVEAIDSTQALLLEGVVDVLTAADIPGQNTLLTGGPVGEEPLFVPLHGTVEAVGMSVAMVLATTRAVANQAAAMVQVKYGAVKAVHEQHSKHKQGQHEGHGLPILSLRDAIEQQSFFSADLSNGAPECPSLKRGDVNSILGAGSASSASSASSAPPVPPSSSSSSPSAVHMLSGEIECPGQKHFYFEPQTTLATLGEAVEGVGATVHLVTSTQGPCNMQQSVSSLLALPNHCVTVTARRAGGSFGGKLTRCLPNAGAAAVGAWKTKRAVVCCNDRATDFAMVGGREPMLFKYDVGFDDKGVIRALRLVMYMDAGVGTVNTL
jgi:xanthine dehydrogenase molybdopterin-binding subunit B